MKKIIYIHQYFLFPSEGGATRSYWFVKKLISEGHNVKVITSNHNLTTEKKGLKNIDGIQIMYLDVNYSNHMSKPKKILSFLKFSILSTIHSLFEKNVDIIISTSTPITVGVPALANKFLKKTKYIFEVRDLWPDFPIQIGAIKSKVLISILRFFEREIYRNASWIIALSPGMKKGVIRAYPKATDKISMLPNMSKPEIFYPREKKYSILEQYNISKEDFLVIHFGTMGPANGLDYLIDAFKLLNDFSGYRLILLGQGAMKEHLSQRIKEENIGNVTVIPYLNTKETSELVNCCDLSVVSFLNLEILKTNSPNKFFDSLSAGIPIIVNSNGWTKDIVESNNCGSYVDPTDPNLLAEKIKFYRESPTLRIEQSQNSRKLSVNVYDKKKITEKFSQIISSLDTQ